ncbi:XdhC family protein [Streptomyces sp. NPDC001002]
MRDLLPALAEWYAAKRPFAVATVTGVEGSSPRRLGAVSVRGSAGELLGGISGDPLDAALHELSGRVLADGCPQVAWFDTELTDPFEPDLPSAGSVEVLVRRVDPATDEAFALFLTSLARGVAVTLALTVDCAHPERVGSALAVTREAVRGTLGSEKWDRECLYRQRVGGSGIMHLGDVLGGPASFFLLRQH